MSCSGDYENFSVISLLLPKQLKQDFANVYAFCRTADDLGDEVPIGPCPSVTYSSFASTPEACHGGDGRSPLFVALARTIRKHEIPIQPSLDLIDAFEQDQRVNRYENFGQVVDYCRRMPIRSAGWCSICVAIATRSGSGFRIASAPPCSLPISGRTFAGTFSTAIGSISRRIPCGGMGWTRTRSGPVDAMITIAR